MPFGAIYEMWRGWKYQHTYPYHGGWLDQPLTLLVQINAIDFVYETYRYKTAEKADWSKMSPTQIEVIRWLDG